MTKGSVKRMKSIRYTALAGVLLVLVAVAGAQLNSGHDHARAAVSQVTRMYGCVQPDGLFETYSGPKHRAKIRAFDPGCSSQSQLVSWGVRGEPFTTTTTVPATTTTAAQTTTTKPTVPGTIPPVENERPLPGTYLTAYDWQDNNPPNSGIICCPSIHQTAGGTGTYADPITVAVDHYVNGQMQYPRGARFYVPNVRRYFIAEDTTGELAPSTIHLDLWADGRTSSTSSAFNCMSKVTGHFLVIAIPRSNFAVVPGPMSANNVCTATYGDTLVLAP